MIRPLLPIRLTYLSVILLTLASCTGGTQTVRISADLMRDKIKGGWVGQTVGVCYGGATEFRLGGALVQDDVPVEYDENIRSE